MEDFLKTLRINGRMAGLTSSTKFFKPDDQMLKWLADYAGNRMIVDVGCGSAQLIFDLHDKCEAKVVGIEPHWDITRNHDRIKNGKDMIQVMPDHVEDCFLTKKIKNSLIICCRPCHSGFHLELPRLFDKSNEILYIGLERNFYTDEVEDLEIIPHKGSSLDDEVVLQLQKPNEN